MATATRTPHGPAMMQKPETAPSDPYVLSPEEVRQPPATIGQALHKIGPGMILAASIVGTGELIQTTNAGAAAGFAILWLVILSCFIKVFVQIELGRFALSTGETTLLSFARLPIVGMLFVWWWFFMALTTQTQISTMIGGIGQIFHMALPGVTSGLARPALPWAILIAILSAVLLVRGTYKLIERSMTILVVVFTFLTVACVVLLPFNPEYGFDLGDLASGLTFHLPTDPAVLAVAFAMIGITGVGASELMSYPYWCIEKGYARNVGPRDESAGWLQRARGWLRVMKLDAWLSMVVYTVATLAFFILGAAALYNPNTAGNEAQKRDTPEGMMQSLAQMYVPVLGETGALVFILIGGFVVLFSTLIAASAANARLITDFLRVNGFIAAPDADQRRRWVAGFCIAIMTLGVLLFVAFPSPFLMVTIGGFAQAITLPMIAAAAIYLRYRRTDRRLTPGLVWDIFLWLSLLAFVIAAAHGVGSQLRKLF